MNTVSFSRVASILALSLFALGSSQAHAQDASDAAVHDWSGFYVGGSISYRDGSLTNSDCVGTCAPTSDGLSGAYLGAQLGFDQQLDNNFVVGGFIMAGLAGPSETLTTQPVPFDFKVKPNFGFTAAGRVGYAVDNFLPYAFAGLGVAEVKAKSEFGVSSTATHFGVTLGAGVDYALNDNWSIGAMYMYNHAFKEAYDFGGGVSHYGENAHTGTFKIDYHF